MCHHTQSQETACRLDSLQAVLEILCKVLSTGPGKDCDLMIQHLNVFKKHRLYLFYSKVVSYGGMIGVFGLM